MFGEETLHQRCELGYEFVDLGGGAGRHGAEEAVVVGGADLDDLGQGMHRNRTVSLAGHAVEQQWQGQTVIEVGMGEEDVVDAGDGLAIEPGHAGAGIDEALEFLRFDPGRARRVLDHLGNPPIKSGWSSPERAEWQRDREAHEAIGDSEFGPDLVQLLRMGGQQGQCPMQIGRQRVTHGEQPVDRLSGRIDSLQRELATAKVWALLLYITLAGAVYGTLARTMGWI